jgi:hypothetical protein
MIVLRVRHTLTGERLAAMTPAELLAFAAQTDARMPATVTPATPVVVDDVATLRLMDGGRDTGVRMTFLRVGGRWRLDGLPVLAQVGCIVRHTFRQRGIGRDQEDELLLRTLQATTGRAPSPDIWQPLVRTAANP